MKSELPPTAEPQILVYERATRQGIATLKENLEAPRLPPQTLVDEDAYSRTHLLPLEGWQAPAPEIVRAYFRHFQQAFPDYKTDPRLAALLGVSSSRRMREYKTGACAVPYHVWRHFLVITGRVPPEVPKVFAFMGEVDGQREMPL